MSDRDFTTLPHPSTYYMNLQQGSDTWKEARKDFPITGSQIASVFNLSAYGGNPKKLLRQKKSNTEEQFSRYQTEVIFAHGTRNEPVAAAEFEAWFKSEFPERSQWSVAETGISPYRSNGKKYYYGASPDRLLVDEQGKIQGIVEIKCPFKKVFHWNGFLSYLSFLSKNGTTPTKVTETCNIRVYTEYFLQMQMQMSANGVDFGYFVGWTPSQLVILHIPFHAEFWSRAEHIMDDFVDALKLNKEELLIKKEASKKFEAEIKELQDNCNKLVYFNIKRDV